VIKDKPIVHCLEGESSMIVAAQHCEALVSQWSNKTYTNRFLSVIVTFAPLNRSKSARILFPFVRLLSQKGEFRTISLHFDPEPAGGFLISVDLQLVHFLICCDFVHSEKSAFTQNDISGTFILTRLNGIPIFRPFLAFSHRS